MTAFKICGLRELGHALAATDAGADYLGFVFVPGVRRRISADRASEIIQECRRLRASDMPAIVGLFANQTLEDVNQIVRHCSLEFAQLCGDEPPEYWERVEAPVIRQIKVREDRPRDETIDEVRRRVDEVVSGMHTALLDKHQAGHLGGAGKSFDWSIARDVARSHEFLLAGGLTPENVLQAITEVSPWGVDVSSGIETDGVKDLTKIAAFAEEVRRADEAIPESRRP